MKAGKTEEFLNRNLVIPQRTEQKIEAAYDIVRSKCRERKEEAGDLTGKKSQERTLRRRRVLRPSMAAALAAAMVLLCGMGVLAAVRYFNMTVEERDDGASYTFEVNYELKPVEVTAVPGYLPEDIKDMGEGKYGSGEDDGRSITIWAMNMADIDYYNQTMDFTGVEKVEKTTIQGMEAHLLTFQDAEKYRRSKDIYLFNSQEGYVIWLWADYAVSMDELVRVAENLTITAEEDPDLQYYMTQEEKSQEAAEEQKAQEEWEAIVNRGVAREDITPAGETLDVSEFLGASYTVEEAAFYDSLYEVPGYTEDGVCDREELEPWLNEDGTHKPYLRSELNENGEIVKEERADVKFLAVKATVRQEKAYGEWTEGTPFDAALVLLAEGENGRLAPSPERYVPVPSEDYQLQMDGYCFYLDQPADTMKDPQYFWRYMEEGDSQTYTMIFAVDADLAEDQARLQNLVLRFNGTGNDPENPKYSALW